MFRAQSRWRLNVAASLRHQHEGIGVGVGEALEPKLLWTSPDARAVIRTVKIEDDPVPLYL